MTSLILPKGSQQIGEGLLRNGTGADRFGKRNKHGMTRAAFVAGIEFAAPEVEKSQGLCRVADLVAKIVRDAAVGVDRMEMRSQRLGQEP